MDEIIILRMETTDTIDILCYERDYNKMYANEDKLCHYFKIKPIDKNIMEKMKEKLIDYCMYINENDKEIEFYNYSAGDSILFNYSEINELNYGHEEIIRTKIQYLLNENDRLINSLNEKCVHINNVEIYFDKELKNINRKIEFFEKNNNVKRLHENIGKREMIERIKNKIMEIR